MEDKEDIEEVFLSRIRKIDSRIAQEALSAIMSRPREQVEVYLSGSDGDIRSLIDQTRQSMKLKSVAHSPGRAQKPAHIRVENQFQSSSKPGVGCSNTMAYPPSSPVPHIPCNYYVNGFCMRDASCPRRPSGRYFIDGLCMGFRPLGKLEMEIRELLLLARPIPVLVQDLPTRYYLWYKKLLHIDASVRNIQWDGRMQWDGMIQCDGMGYNLSCLHTVLTFPDRYGNIYMGLLEDGPRYQDQGDGNGADQIYITFHPRSRLTEGDVRSYFSHYGFVTYVKIPAVDKCRKFGFVRFAYPQTVNLLLSQRDPSLPHLICGARVFAKCYKPIAERIPTEGDNGTQLRHASDVPKEETGPEHNTSILSSCDNERCPHLLCEIMTSSGVQSTCKECQKLLSQIMKLVRMREKCLECGELLKKITESVRKSENCARCRELLRQIIQFSEQQG